MDAALRALNRFGLGARVGERAEIGSPRAWLRGQLTAVPTTPSGAELDEIVASLVGLREAQRTREPERLTAARRTLQELRDRDQSAVLTNRVTTDAPFVERLAAFWSNHLCVSAAGNQQVAALAGHYERTVVRPHVLGRFADMVLASAKHPAMLIYLDNAQSIGPGSPAARQAQRRGRERGLNENYARELLELHTLGVDGGYSQEDVQQLARILTGWTVAGLGPGAAGGERPGFIFRPQVHEPGDKTVLGVRYREAGVREGERVIETLCAHPATAAFVAGKLVQHFVSDEPSATAVDRIARVFRESDGNLREVALALVDLEDAWLPDNRKFRTPQDWLVATLRAVRVREVPPRMAPLLGQLRHPLWGPSAPKGYGDSEREWADPDALMNRAELARSLATGVGRAARIDPARLVDVVDIEDGDPLRALLADAGIAPSDRLALAVGGPAFQWR